MNLGWRTGLSPGKPLLLIHKNAINYDRIRDRTDVPAAVFDRDLAVMREYRSIPRRDFKFRFAASLIFQDPRFIPGVNRSLSLYFRRRDYYRVGGSQLEFDGIVELLTSKTISSFV